MSRGMAIRPFAARGRRTVVAILATFALFSATSVGMSIGATQRSQHRAAVVQVAARQRTLAERYVQEVLLTRAGIQSDPEYLASLLRESARSLLDGGTAPAVNGDDDEIVVEPARGSVVRAQLSQERRLVADLTATGSALLARRPVEAVSQTAHENVTVTDPVSRLRVLAALTSNVSLNAARTIAVRTDRNVGDLIKLQVALGIAGVFVSVLLGWGLIAATRRQTAHFRSLVTSSTDLVLVFRQGECRYASRSVTAMVGQPERRVLGPGFMRSVHPDDRALVEAASVGGEPGEIEFLVEDRFGEWRHLEAHVTDLRADRQLRGVVFNARDITERVRLEQELSHQAFHDGLTGLANRALFHDRLDQALARSERSHDALAVLIVDLDRFKQVNDSLGHGSGDGLLQQLAQRFSEVIRPSDTLARLGGDEFALLLDGAGQVIALEIAHRLLERLRDPVSVATRELVLDASVGIAVHAGGPGASEELVRRADVAMYAAKRSGGGHCEVFRADMTHEQGDLLELENELRRGLQLGEFAVHYQPEVDLATHAIVGVEALVRWNSPTRGVVMPDQFIPVAETTGLIMPLGELVLRQACVQAAQWRHLDLLPDLFVVWVNLSGKQLSTGGISVLVRRTLEAAGLPAKHLGLEVTETAIIVEGPAGTRTRAELDELHALGVRIAIDDFGTGFSSLKQLRRFPIDVIKVDQSFIQGMEHDAKSATITANVASLAHALGMVAVAEGIESSSQLESARDLGCDLAQGYFFARPAPADEVTRLLVTHRDEPGAIESGAVVTGARHMSQQVT
ncbi:MAG: EAL domain-containing protein [Actinobacteria bacterium]|nr:MAG: EAL domain-containing protein [Actinomycetota bacterium]